METDFQRQRVVIDHVQTLADDLPGLEALLIDCVKTGASIGFLPPLAPEDAKTYWQGVAENVATGTSLLLIARVGCTVLGTVQLALAGKANARHRAEVEKLMVAPDARKKGIASTLMAHVDDLAAQHGRHLLVLDTREGDVSEQVYLRCGFRRVGVIPEFALSASGDLDGTAIFYKLLA